MSLQFRRIKDIGPLYEAVTGVDNPHSYQIEGDSPTAWRVTISRPAAALMVGAGAADTFAADMRFSSRVFGRLRDARAACEEHLAAEVVRARDI